MKPLSSLNSSVNPTVKHNAPRRRLRIPTIPMQERHFPDSLPSSISGSLSNSSSMAKKYYNLTPNSARSSNVKSFTLSYDSLQPANTPKAHKVSYFTNTSSQSEAESLTTMLLSQNTSFQDSPDATSPLYAPRAESTAGLLQEKEKLVQRWRVKYYNSKKEAGAQAKLIEQLQGRVGELKQQVDQKEKAATRGTEKVLVNKNAEIRRLEKELEVKTSELKALHSLKIVTQTSKELRKSKPASPKVGTLTYSHTDVLELIKENEELKTQLKKTSNELSQEVLNQLDIQFAELEEMQTKLLAENEALRNDKGCILAELNQQTELKFQTVVGELAKLKAELRQINSIAKGLTQGHEFSLEMLLGKPADLPSFTNPTKWDKITSLMREVKHEVSTLRQVLSDNVATHCTSKGCVTQ